MRCVSCRFGHQNNSVSIDTASPFLSLLTTCVWLVPVMGMLCGNAIGAIMVSQSYILKELELVVLSLWRSHLAERVLIFYSENRDKTETLLAFGASRFEACRPLAVDALRLALMPVVNQMRYVRA